MATVYLAEDLRHDRPVAVKVLKPELAAIVGSDRFLAEIKTTAKLRHPHILPLFDSGTADGFLYFVTPYVPGDTLRERLDQGSGMAEGETVSIAADLAEALDYAHRQGVIHRDIKPSNILMLEGRPVIADFGVALAVDHLSGSRITATGLSVGTPSYMSPEQAVGDEMVDARTDQYSLACLVYEMLVGEPPHTGSNAQAILAKIITEEPAPVTDRRSDVSDEVSAALAVALSRDPENRFDGMRDFARAMVGGGEGGSGAFATSQRAATPRPASRRRLMAAMAAVGAVALMGLAAFGWSRMRSVEPAPEARERSIAVLPFDDLSPAQDQEYFVRGLSEEILVALTQIDELKVSGRASTFALTDSDLDVATIADRLGVAHVLDGSVRRAGDRVRISVHLLEVATGFDLWSDSFDSDLTDIFAVQDSIARTIADQLRITLGPGANATAGRLVATSTASPEAYEAYLRGRYFRGISTDESLRIAIEEYRTALELDEEFAEAWAALAEANLLLNILWGGIDLGTAHERALRQASSAVELDPELVLGHVMLGFVLTEMGDWAEAESELRTAVELGPGDPEAHKRLGNVLWQTDRPDEGIRELDRAIELDPVDRLTIYSRVWAYLSDGRLEEALNDTERLIELDRNWPTAWEVQVPILVRLGRYDEARSANDVWVRLTGADAVLEEGALEAMIRYDRTGEPQEYDYPLDSPSGPGRALFFYGATGQFERLLPGLSGMVQVGAINAVNRLHQSLELRGLREDPRYQALLQQAGITW